MPGHVVPRDASVATGPLEIKDHSLQGLVHQIGFVPDQIILRAGGSGHRARQQRRQSLSRHPLLGTAHSGRPWSRFTGLTGVSLPIECTQITTSHALAFAVIRG
jgi:hypothetical protein